MVFNQIKMKIILKVDDFWGENTLNHPVFREFLDFILEKKIKISLGIVGKGMEKTSEKAKQFLLPLLDDLIEPFNHSYWHMLNPKIISEFNQTSEKYQKLSIEKTNQIVTEKIGYKLKGIGFVANSFDETTIKVMRESSFDFLYILQSNDLRDFMEREMRAVGKNVLFIEELFGIEKGMRVVYQDFANNQKNLIGKEFVIFQLHPDLWDRDSLDNFKIIINYLILNRDEFIFPSQI